MATVKVTILNQGEVEAALRAAGIAVRDVLEAAVMAGAALVEEKAGAKAPSADGVGSELVSRGRGAVTAAVGATKDNWHYIFIERGRRGGYTVRVKEKKALRIGARFAMKARPGAIAPRPFLRPAVDENIEAIRDEVGKPIKAALESV